MDYYQYAQWMQNQQQNSFNQFCFNWFQNKIKAELAELNLQLKRELTAKNNQALLLKTVLHYERSLRAENQKLLMEKNSLTNSFESIKIELAELEAQQRKKLENVLQKQENLRAENALLKGDSKELAMLKQQYSELAEERCQLKLELDNRTENVNALNAANEMLSNGNENRDETIAKYEKQLQKYLKLSSSCDNVASQQQERRFGCKALHALSALGAENTAGPWLCSRCGTSDSPINIPSYAEFRQHLIQVHKETIDPALCEHCGWRSTGDRQLHFHMSKKHQIGSLFYTVLKSAILGKDYDYDQQY